MMLKLVKIFQKVIVCIFALLVIFRILDDQLFTCRKINTMQERHSIQEIIKIYETGGSHPLLVTCDDLQEWVCKNDRTTLNLFNELLGYRFGQLWGLRMPEIAQVTIHERHIPIHMRQRLQPYLFQKMCFGSKFLEYAELIDLTTLASFLNSNFRRKIVNKVDFLKIALFDLWLANEDRNHNNFNMLLEFVGNKIYFICPIDHVMLFNSAHLDYEPVLLTDDEGIIRSLPRGTLMLLR